LQKSKQIVTFKLPIQIMLNHDTVCLTIPFLAAS